MPPQHRIHPVDLDPKRPTTSNLSYRIVTPITPEPDPLSQEHCFTTLPLIDDIDATLRIDKDCLNQLIDINLIKHIFSTCHKKNIPIAIVTNHSHPHLIVQALHHYQVIPQGHLAHVCVIAGTAPNGKNNHIEAALDIFGLEPTSKNALLVDDNRYNSNCAHHKGYTSIHATRQTTHWWQTWCCCFQAGPRYLHQCLAQLNHPQQHIEVLCLDWDGTLTPPQPQKMTWKPQPRRAKGFS